MEKGLTSAERSWLRWLQADKDRRITSWGVDIDNPFSSGEIILGYNVREQTEERRGRKIYETEEDANRVIAKIMARL